MTKGQSIPEVDPKVSRQRHITREGFASLLERFPALVEGHPAPPVLFTSADLRPRQSTAHAVFLECPRRPGAKRRARLGLSLWQFGNPEGIDSPLCTKGQEGGVAVMRQGPHPFSEGDSS